jgi:uncharacterized membrane protein YgcG
VAPPPDTAPPGASASSAPRIRDDGQLFTRQTLARADAMVQAIKDRYGINVIVQTYATIPDDAPDPASLTRDQTFMHWATGRLADQYDNRGIYLVILRHPGRTFAIAGDRTAGVFTHDNSDALWKMIDTGLREQKFDNTLVDALQFVHQNLDKNGAPLARHHRRDRAPN